MGWGMRAREYDRSKDAAGTHLSASVSHGAAHGAFCCSAASVFWVSVRRGRWCEMHSIWQETRRVPLPMRGVRVPCAGLCVTG